MTQSTAIGLVCTNAHRVQIQFRQLRYRCSQSRHITEQARDCVSTHSTLTTNAIQQGPQAKFIQHRQALIDTEWRMAKRHVLEHLDQNAAKPHHHHRAKNRVTVHTDNEFNMSVDHGLK